MANGIHYFSGDNPPTSLWIFVLNSFVLSAQEVDVNYAPKLGLCPHGKNLT